MQLIGRKQAYFLYEALGSYSFDSVYSSDLQRGRETAFYAMGFANDNNSIQEDERLRELFFGDEEGIHFDGMSESDKQRFNSHEFKAKGGESWKGVQKRTLKFLNALTAGNHLVFTHGGVICSLLYHHGYPTIPTNCSVFGVALKNQTKTDIDDIEKVLFSWEYPVLEDEI